MTKAIWTKITVVALLLWCLSLSAQEPAATSAKPTEHILGTITGVDKTLHTVSLKEDGSGSIRTIQVAETKTLLKVQPGAKDVKGAERITADDLTAGDRVDVRGFKVEADPTAIAARSVILMSGRDVQQAHQVESAAWQHAAAGTVTAQDATSQKLTVTLRTAEGPKPATVDASKAQFSRFSPEQPQTPASSKFADIQTGDQVRVIGERSPDGTAITAQKIYSGSFKSTAGTLVSLTPDGKGMVVKDLTTKQPVTIALTEASSIRKLSPMMAMMLARRFNPDFKAAPANGTATPAAESSPANAGGGPRMRPGTPPGESGTAAEGAPAGRMRATGNGDISQMLERIPKISLTDLKPGDAVIVSGSPSGTGSGQLLATTVIAGVEPIFQSASPRQAQSLGDWNAGLGGGAAMDAAGNGAPGPQ